MITSKFSLNFSILMFFCLILGNIEAANIRYSVYFIGVNDAATLKTLRDVSDLVSLQDRPPHSINALRYRAESDIPEMIKAMRAHGFYEASLAVRLEEDDDQAIVYVMIATGPLYTIGSCKVESLHHPISPQEINITIGQPALATDVIKAEEKALLILSENGYPLAKIKHREFIADGNTKTISLRFDIDDGPCSFFGPLQIYGALTLKPLLFQNKQAWQEGEVYNSALIEQTQTSLIDTGLFSSVIISHLPNTEEQNQLPIRIEVTESKHKSINVGISYQTFFGPGITFGWENRNIDGMGRKLSLQGDATKKTHSGIATLYLPDFYAPNQDDVFILEAAYESIYTYLDRSYSATNRFEKRIDAQYRFSAGLKLERLLVKESVDDGQFTLLEGPLYFRWSSANSFLNPTHGHTFEYKIVPSYNSSRPEKYYAAQSLAFMTYWPILTNDAVVIAQQILVDSIFSKKLDSIPVPKRVLGGTDQELRGYRYKTVSPLRGHKPIGGRSGIFYSIEFRFTFFEKIGIVPFLDIGSVALEVLPNVAKKWYQSTGLGIRYFSFLGPLRLDIAFPLNRRPDIDSRYRVLLSLGQTF